MSEPRMRLPRHLFIYLVVGGITVVVDIGLLALLHELYRVSLSVATTVAYCTAVVVNFLLNRTAMSARGSRGLTQHALRYGSLVAANYVITLAVVTTAGQESAWYLVAKTAVVVASTSWNFLLYRHWVFSPPRPGSEVRGDQGLPPGERRLDGVASGDQDADGDRSSSACGSAAAPGRRSSVNSRDGSIGPGIGPAGRSTG